LSIIELKNARWNTEIRKINQLYTDGLLRVSKEVTQCAIIFCVVVWTAYCTRWWRW